MIKLGEMAQVEVKSPNLYSINLIEYPEHAKNILNAIIKSNLNVTPQLEKNNY